MSHALSVLSWMELPEDDRPAESIWLNDEALVEHFENVRSRHSSPSGGGSEPVPDLEQNELTKGLRRGR